MRDYRRVSFLSSWLQHSYSSPSIVTEHRPCLLHVLIQEKYTKIVVFSWRSKVLVCSKTHTFGVCWALIPTNTAFQWCTSTIPAGRLNFSHHLLSLLHRRVVCSCKVLRYVSRRIDMLRDSTHSRENVWNHRVSTPRSGVCFVQRKMKNYIEVSRSRGTAASLVDPFCFCSFSAQIVMRHDLCVRDAKSWAPTARLVVASWYIIQHRVHTHHDQPPHYWHNWAGYIQRGWVAAVQEQLQLSCVTTTEGKLQLY